METLAIIEEGRTARLAGNRRRCREPMKRSMVQLQADRERVASDLAKEAEEDLNRNNLQPAIREIKRLCSVSAPGLNTHLKKDGVVVMGHMECRE